MRAKAVVAAACGVGVFASVAWANEKITLVTGGTSFSGVVGIDYHEPTDSVVVSTNYPSGSPFTFERILPNGTHVPFSTVSGFTDEVKIATVRSGNVGGFTTGELFTGNGNDGEISRISADGLTVTSTWVSLPGASNGLMRGSLHVDQNGGSWGGDLVVATTAGEVWRVDSAGTPTFIAGVGTHLEGLWTLPDDVATWGPLAGKAIAGAEGVGLLYAFGTDGSVATYSLGVLVEDIDMVIADANFVGVNYGSSRLLTSDASDWTNMVGDILLTQEFSPGGTSGLFRMYWNGSALVSEPIDLRSNSQTPGQWEHVTFAPTIVPGTSAMAILGLSGLASCRRRRA